MLCMSVVLPLHDSSGVALLHWLCCAVMVSVCPSANADTAVHMHGSPVGTVDHNALLVFSHMISLGPCTDAINTDDT